MKARQNEPNISYNTTLHDSRGSETDSIAHETHSQRLGDVDPVAILESTSMSLDDNHGAAFQLTTPLTPFLQRNNLPASKSGPSKWKVLDSVEDVTATRAIGPKKDTASASLLQAKEPEDGHLDHPKLGNRGASPDPDPPSPPHSAA